MNTQLKQTIDSIQPVSDELEPAIQQHLDDLVHPQGSLGRLEEIAMRYCKIHDTLKPTMGKKIIYTFAGDHGVADEGVSNFPKEVTQQMVYNLSGGSAGVNVFANHAGAEVRVADVGVDFDFAEDTLPDLVRRKVKHGTNSLRTGPAMSCEEAEQAILVGVEMAQQAKSEGATLLGTGEMGIANTTPSAALFAALIPCEAEVITGRGTGINDERLQHKINVIAEGLEANKERLTDPVNIMAAVGGLEIAAICGLCLGAAAARIPVVVDGFISSAAAYTAVKLNPAVKDYLFFSHRSAEAGHSLFLKEFNTEPLLNLDMRLGEGTGAALAFTLVEAALKMYNEMITFSGTTVSEPEKPDA